MEGPLHWRHERNGRKFTRPPLVSSNTPSGATTIAPPKITCPPQGPSIRPGIRDARLQRSIICAHRNGNVGAWQAKAEGHLGRLFQQRIHPWYIFWILPRMVNVDEGHKSNNNLCNRFPQARVHHQRKHNPRRQRHGHIRQVGGRAQRPHGHPPRRNGSTSIGVTGDHSQAGIGPSRKSITAPSNSKQTSLQFAELGSYWKYPRKPPFHTPISSPSHFPTTVLYILTSRGPSGNFQPGTQPHRPDQIQIKNFLGNLHGPARARNQLPLDTHSHTPSTPEYNTSKGGAISKGGTTSDAAAVPTTGGPTYY